MTNRTAFLRPVFFAAIIAAISGCGKDTGGSGGGTMIVSEGGDAATLFPLLVQDEVGRTVTDLVFEHLAEIGDGMNTIGDGGFQPRVAKSWDWAKDSMSIAFHVDPAARFHDGVPVRASDVKFSFKLAADSTLQSSVTPLITNIDSVHIADSLTAVFHFKRHTPEEFYDIAYQLPVLPEHVYGKVAAAALQNSELLRNPVGTGRFRFVRWEAGNRIELIADTANYHGRAKLDRVVFLLTQSPDAASSSVLAGESDVYSAFPLDQVARLDSSKVVRGLPNLQMVYGYLGMNLRERKSKTKPHPIFSDTAVRRAISMSLDRVGMLTNVFNGHGLLGHGPFPLGLATSDTTITLPAYDTVKAKAVLDAAGWKTGPNGIRSRNGRPLKFQLMVPSSSGIRLRYGDLIQESLRRVGIQVDLDKVPYANFIPRSGSGDYDAMLNGINTDPGVSGTKQYWSTEGDKAGTNFQGYINPKVDALLDSAGRAKSADAMKPIMRQAFQMIVNDVPSVWLYNGFTEAAVNRRFDAQPFRADGWWVHLADWSIPADKRIDRDRLGLSSKKP